MKTKLTVLVALIKPSKYDDEGYVVRYWKGVLPSNTLACLRSLTMDFSQKWRENYGIDIDLKCYDDLVEAIPYKYLAKSITSRKIVVAGLVGVQTNQFPRAADIAKKLAGLGIHTVIGGFHISGILSMFGEPTPEIKELIDNGITVVEGEAEEVWENILSDVISGKSKGLYRKKTYPDIGITPVPQPDPSYMKKFAVPDSGTMDCSRGCPFSCSFCTIINVQGRKMRFRKAHHVISAIKNNYLRGIDKFFFTDDNFSRNPDWEAVFDGLIRLREMEKLKINFMMQVDMACTNAGGFIEKAARAGCTQVFIGMESINPLNLDSAEKKQNKVESYASFVEEWHKAGVETHAGYIIGFPYDTPESVRNDMIRLKEEIRVDLASFFILTPLPGSKDHYNLMNSGTVIDPDLNKYDSTHVTTPHPAMNAEELLQTYWEAWESFYTAENMRRILIRSGSGRYWGILKNFVWYKSSLLEPNHPMITGFIRLKDRLDVRTGTPVRGRYAYMAKRVLEMKNGLRRRIPLLFEILELWYLTRKPEDPVFKSVADISSVAAYARESISRINCRDEFETLTEHLSRKISEIHKSLCFAGNNGSRIDMLFSEIMFAIDRLAHAEDYSIAASRFIKSLSNTARQIEECAIYHVAKRRKINNFWKITKERFTNGQIIPFTFSIPGIIIYAIRDIWIILSFGHKLLHKSF